MEQGDTAAERAGEERMLITFLGHAGFLVETADAIVLADPWLSPEGAFDSAWMQFPQNHHLADVVREKMETTPKARYVYLSHEHKDHFDPAFLDSIRRRDFTLVIPKFQRTEMRDVLASYGAKELLVVEDGERIPLPGGGHLKLFVQDSSLNRDSALLVHAEGRTFLDLNDCKLHDRLPRIAREEGPIHVFTAQFSGAIWHPPCYAYEQKQYETISRRKMFSKFEAVARGIDVLKPRVFLSSAGPACFLDPRLLPINFQPVNIFPRAGKFFTYVQKRLKNCATALAEPMPGDVLDAETFQWVEQAAERVTDENFESYVRAYAERMAPLFAGRVRNLAREEVEATLVRLACELQRKLDHLVLHDRVSVPLYVSLEEMPGNYLRVDFGRRRVEPVPAITDEKRYTMEVGAADIARVLDGLLTWEDFLLAMRLRMSRNPDDYDAILHGYLAIEAEDLPAFCQAVLEAESRQERMVVEAGGGRRVSVHRYCPHQGADLSEAWVEGGRYLTCPRHRWQFDLEEGGRCTMNNTSIHALPVVGDENEAAEGPGAGTEAPAGGAA